jgi:hypothetical protein
LAKVNSSAMTARHPDVPNLICVAIFVISLRAAASRQQVLADRVPIALGCWNVRERNQNRLHPKTSSSAHYCA